MTNKSYHNLRNNITKLKNFFETVAVCDPYLHINVIPIIIYIISLHYLIINTPMTFLIYHVYDMERFFINIFSYFYR